MIYILLDTNIVIDMVIDRRNVFSSRVIEKFIKILDYQNVKLLVPNIVKIETYRHLDEQIEEVGKNIKKAKEAVNNLYGISSFEKNGLDLSKCKNESIKPLNKAFDEYESNIKDYKIDVKNAINILFNHESSIIINDDRLMSKVLQRKIYKKAPFHKEAKESNGDGIITETLINIKDYIDFNEDDSIYFVTGNYKDFSKGSKERREFHPDIYNDLVNAGIVANVKYVQYLKELVDKHLREVIENAEDIENLYNTIEFEEKIQLYELEMDIEDSNRESVGLSRLGSFEYEFSEKFSESEFSTGISNCFSKINSSYSSCEDLFVFYDGFFDSVEALDGNYVLEKMQKFCSSICGNSISDFCKFYHWIEDKKNLFDVSLDFLPDSYGFDNNYTIITRTDSIKLILSIDGLEYLSPESDGTDYLEINILQKDNLRPLAKGTIEIYYGYIKFDENGNVGNGAEESIEYCCDEIMDILICIAQEWETFIEKEIELMEEIKDELGI